MKGAEARLHFVRAAGRRIPVGMVWGRGSDWFPAKSPSSAGPAPQSYAEVVDRVAPAVVTIRSARRIHASQQFPFLNDSFPSRSVRR
jgi:S1-C subfamily serine protease